MEIQQKYVVGSELFDTREEAEAYIAESKDRLRVEAFIEHLKAQGAQRITRTVTEAVEEFIRFENGEYDTPDTAEQEPVAETESESVTDTTTEQAASEPTDTATSTSVVDSTSLFQHRAEPVESEPEPVTEPPAETQPVAESKSLFG